MPPKVWPKVLCPHPGCGRMIATNSNTMSKHMGSHAPKPPPVAIPCTHAGCPRTFLKASNMRRHVEKIHTNPQPRRPSTRPKKTAATTGLPPKPRATYRKPCPFPACKGKMYTHLNWHLRTHTGERPFVCGECGVAYTNTSNLDRHVRRNHGGAGAGFAPAGDEGEEDGEDGGRPAEKKRRRKRFEPNKQRAKNGKGKTPLVDTSCPVPECGFVGAGLTELADHVEETHSAEEMIACGDEFAEYADDDEDEDDDDDDDDEGFEYDEYDSGSEWEPSVDDNYHASRRPSKRQKLPTTDEGDLPDFDDVVVPDDYVPDLDSILHMYQAPQDPEDATFTPAMQEAAALSMALARSRPPVNMFHPLPAQGRSANPSRLPPAVQAPAAFNAEAVDFEFGFDFTAASGSVPVMATAAPPDNGFSGNFFQVGSTTSPLDIVMDTGLAGQDQLPSFDSAGTDAMEFTKFPPLDFDPFDLDLDETSNDALFGNPL